MLRKGEYELCKTYESFNGPGDFFKVMQLIYLTSQVIHKISLS